MGVALGCIRAEASPVEIRFVGEDAEPVAPVKVTLSGPSKRTLYSPEPTTTLNLKDGNYNLRGKAAGYKSVSTTFIVPSDEPVVVVFDYLQDTVTIQGEAESETYELDKEVATVIPGAANDVIKSLQNLPGVGRVPYGLGGLILRGSGPRDTSLYIDDIRVPILYHFGGLTSSYPTTFIDSVELFPGGYNVRNGRSQGGLVRVHTFEPQTDKWRMGGELSLIDAQARATGPVAGGGLALGLRRSYIDQILRLVSPNSERVELTVAPRYMDGQMLYSRTGSWGKIKFIGFGSDDKVRARQPDFDMIPENDEDFGLHQGFFRLGITSEFYLTPTWTLVANPWWGMQTSNIEFGKEFTDFTGQEYGGRLAARHLIDNWRTEFGLDMNGGTLDFSTARKSGGMLWEQEFKDSANYLGFYGQTSWRINDAVSILPGARVDYISSTDEFLFNPRLAVTQRFGPFVAEQKIGKYSQPPATPDRGGFWGNPDLKSSSSIQTSASIKAEWEHTKVSVAGFYEILNDQPVDAVTEASPIGSGRLRGGVFNYSLEAAKDQFGSFAFQDNVGAGRNRGFELFLRHRRSWGEGWVAYTHSTTNRRGADLVQPQNSPYSLDQPHVLTAVVLFRLPRNWLLSSRFRYATGYPYTPVVDKYYDPIEDDVVPVSGALLSKRLPAFVQWDIRAQKTWKPSWGNITLFLDIQNIANRDNVEGIQWDPEFTQRQFNYGLPLIPTIGVEIVQR